LILQLFDTSKPMLSVNSLLNSSTTVHGVPSGFEYLLGNYRPTVGCLALYIC